MLFDTKQNEPVVLELHKLRTIEIHAQYDAYCLLTHVSLCDIRFNATHISECWTGVVKPYFEMEVKSSGVRELGKILVSP